MSTEANANEPPDQRRSRHKPERASTAAFREVRCIARTAVASTEAN